MKIKNFIFGLAVTSVVAFAAYAADTAATKPITAASTPAECSMVNISVSFAFENATSAAVKNELDDRLFKLNGFLIQNHIEHLETQSICYKVGFDQGATGGRGQSNKSPHYKLTGTAEYQINSSDNAFKIGQFLTQQKFVVTVSNKQSPNTQCVDNAAKPVAAPSQEAVPAPRHAKEKVGRHHNDNISNILNASPPSEAADPDAIDMLNNQNGPAPDLPGLDQEPPAAEPLK